LDLSDARRFSLCRGDLLDVAFEPARLRREAGRAGVRQFGLSERRLAGQSGERRRRDGYDAQKGAGLDVVTLKRDLKANEMRRALRDFSDEVRDADVSIVYYAGHGVEIDGINYLIPVDAVLERDIDAYDEAIPLDRILAVVEPAKKLRLIILDACRDNPFKSMKHTMAQRMVARGLSKIEPSSPNTLIAYAAKAGNILRPPNATSSARPRPPPPKRRG
jgi:hypothetical protein